MMATLDFDMEDPTDAAEFRLAVHAAELLSAALEFGERLRSLDKYEGDPPKSWAAVRELWHEHMGAVFVKIEG